MAHAEIVRGTYKRKERDVIAVEVEWNEKELIKLVPGSRWAPDIKSWVVPVSWASCVVLRGVFQDRLSLGPHLIEWATPVSVEMDLRTEMAKAKTPDYEVLSKDLYPYQMVGRDFLVRAKEAILADEMGTGKTRQAVFALALAALPAVVICPNSVKYVWSQNVAEWTDGVPYLLDGTAGAKNKIIAAAQDDPRAVVIISYNSVRTMSRLAPYGSVSLRKCRECDKKNGEVELTPGRCQVHPKPLNRIPFRTVVMDEAHALKDPKSQQTRAVWAVAHGSDVEFRWATTGTPIADNPSDLWPILHSISPTDFPTKGQFTTRYCQEIYNPFGTHQLGGLRFETRDEFFQLLNPRFRRMRKTDVLEQLPPKIRQVRFVDLNPKQRALYDQYDPQKSDPEAYMVANNLTAAVRRMQLSSATIATTDAGETVMLDPAPKLDVLEEILEETEGKQIAVCTYHKGLLHLASARLKKKGISHGVLHGDVPAYIREGIRQEFQEGKIRVLLFTISTGGTGLTMTAADTLVFLQRSWSMLENKQAEDRVHRIGSERHESITIIDIVAKDTVEEGQINRLTEKFLRLSDITGDNVFELEAQILSESLLPY